MNYKLAKQLKEAGYPFKEESILIPTTRKVVQVFSNKFVHFDDDKWYHLPTLSELIDATKQKGRQLSIDETDEGWEAVLKDWDSKEYGGRCCSEAGDEIVAWAGYFKTPEKAVAKLYLKLNKKP